MPPPCPAFARPAASGILGLSGRGWRGGFSRSMTVKREQYLVAGIPAVIIVGLLALYRPEALTLPVYIIIGFVCGGLAAAVSVFGKKKK